MITLPILEQATGLSAPLPSDWQGARAHIGPVEQVTPLVNMLSGKTTCGTLTLMSGVLLWGQARLRTHTDAVFLGELAEALFAWQFDWRRMDPNAPPKGKPPEHPVEQSAAMVLRSFTRKSVLNEKKWHSFYQPIMELSHMVSVVRFLLTDSDKLLFKRWLSKASTRLNEIAKAPDLDVPVFSDFEGKDAYRAYCAPRRGAPVPPIVLDLNQDLKGLDLGAAAERHLAALSPATNRYLRNETMTH